MSQDRIRYAIEKSSENITVERITKEADWEIVSRGCFNIMCLHQKNQRRDLKSVYERAIQNYLILTSSQDLPSLQDIVSGYVSLDNKEKSVILDFYQKNPETSIEYSLRGHLRGAIKTINKANGLEEFEIYAENILDKLVRKLALNPSIIKDAKELFTKNLDVVSSALDKECFDILETYRKKIFDD